MCIRYLFDYDLWCDALGFKLGTCVLIYWLIYKYLFSFGSWLYSGYDLETGEDTQFEGIVVVSVERKTTEDGRGWKGYFLVLENLGDFRISLLYKAENMDYVVQGTMFFTITVFAGVFPWTSHDSDYVIYHSSTPNTSDDFQGSRR